MKALKLKRTELVMASFLRSSAYIENPQAEEDEESDEDTYYYCNNCGSGVDDDDQEYCQNCEMD